jgi:hypothetical protein
MNWNIIESGIKHHNLHQWNLGSQYDKLVIVESGVKHPLPLFAMQGLFRPTIFQSYTTFCQSHFMTFICQHLSVPCSNSSVLLTVLSGVNNIWSFLKPYFLFVIHITVVFVKKSDVLNQTQQVIILFIYSQTYTCSHLY